MNDIELIYEKVKEKAQVRLTSTAALEEGFTWDVPVICGETEQGRFWLYADEDVPDPHGLEFVFSVAYQKRTWLRKRSVLRYTHWHPQTIEDAVNDIHAFMTGQIRL